MKPLLSFTGVSARRTPAALTVLLGLTLSLATLTLAHAQGELGSGTISGTGSGPYNYSITFGNLAGATSPVGSVWYAWVPGQFYLPSTPISAFAPAGWTATISGASVQYTANSSASYILAGNSLSGFGYAASFSPATLAATPNSGVSVAYSAGLFSDAGNTFTVQVVPEPSSAILLLCAACGWLCLRGRARRV